MAIVLFVVGFVVGFSSGMVTAVVAALVAGSLVLAPAIVIGCAVRAADRDDRDRGLPLGSADPRRGRTAVTVR